jgi:hypothetical protein
MIKRLAYIVMLLIFAASLSSAKIITGRRYPVKGNTMVFVLNAQLQKDTTKKHSQEDDSKKIKEISKSKRQAKPEKIGEGDNVQDPKTKPKPKRERRPEGLDRPPEIPRRNGN